MTKRNASVIKKSPTDVDCFQCDNTGYYVNRRVFFDHTFLKTYTLVQHLGGLSFMDWNNALAYAQNLVKQEKIDNTKYFAVYNYIRELNNLSLSDGIVTPDPSLKIYPKHLDGFGPEEYAASYGPGLMAKSQTVDEYKAAELAKTKDVPPVLTEEQKEKKRQDLRRLKTRHNLTFEVWVPASKEEKAEEDKRVSEVEAEEAALADQAADPKTGKRKALTKQKQAAKRRKISGDGFRKLDYIAGETNTKDLLSRFLGGDQVPMKLSVESSKNAEGEPRVTLRFLNNASGAEKVRWVLPGEL